MPAERQNVVLVYPVSRDGQRVLMQFHKDPQDPSYNRYNGLSAYPAWHESVAEAAERAMRGAGILQAGLAFRGCVHWSRYDPMDWPLFGHHFRASLPEDAAVIMENDEVRRRWIHREELLSRQVPCWPGDMDILPLVLDDDPRPFHGIMIYDQGVPRQWRFQRC